jgi:hypothetical protein
MVTPARATAMSANPLKVATTNAATTHATAVCQRHLIRASRGTIIARPSTMSRSVV